jgi:hypothetical protein
MLGGTQPANVQYFDGHDFDLYTVNIGQSHLLVIVFEAERGTRAMGAVMNYARPAAEALREPLAAMNEESPPARAPTAPLAPREQFAPPEPPEPVQAPLPIAVPELERLLDQAGHGGNANAFWEAALAEASPDESSINALSYEQARTLGLLPKDDSS